MPSLPPKLKIFLDTRRKLLKKTKLRFSRIALFHMKTRVCLIYFVHDCRYLVLFGSEKYDYIYNKIRYLISIKSSITDIISHNYAKIKIDSYDSVPLENTMTFHDVLILIKSVFNKDKNKCYYNIFFEKTSYDLPKEYVFV